MGILIGIAVLFIILFVLGVSREIIVFIALSMLLLFSVACTIFFVVSFVTYLRSKRADGIFRGLVYSGDLSDMSAENERESVGADREQNEIDKENRRNRMAFASYTVSGRLTRNLFPTDDFMERFYRKNETVALRICLVRKKEYTLDRITQLIIFIGMPVFAGISGVLVPLVLQYSFIFNQGIG